MVSIDDNIPSVCSSTLCDEWGLRKDDTPLEGIFLIDSDVDLGKMKWEGDGIQ